MLLTIQLVGLGVIGFALLNALQHITRAISLHTEVTLGMAREIARIREATERRAFTGHPPSGPQSMPAGGSLRRSPREQLAHEDLDQEAPPTAPLPQG